jgi:hypothetical protein
VRGPAILLGTRRSDGTVRYVVRPLSRIVLGGITATVLGSVALLGISALVREEPDVPWVFAPILVVLPLAVTQREGFDVDVSRGTIRLWRSWAGITYASATLSGLGDPRVRTTTQHGSDSEGRAELVRTTRICWGERYIVATLGKPALTAMLNEARALLESA